jgi:tripartite-type tricarboxylate transporter receptor subunit TctC
LQTVAADPDVIKIFANLGIQSVGTTPDQAVDSIRKDMPIYAQIVDMAGVRRK